MKPQQEKMIDVLREVESILIKKSSNYGEITCETQLFCPNQNIEDGLYMRLSDKVRRLNSLRSGVQDEVGESINDTLKDMIGYCVLILAHSEKKGNES